MRILANPTVLRAVVVLFCAGFAFLMGVLTIRFLKQRITEESEVGEEKPRTLDALPLHVYNTVIQQLKQQKQELMIEYQAEQQRAKASDALNQVVMSSLPCGVVVFGPNGLVRSINPAAKAILGFASLIGMSPEDIFRGSLARNDDRAAADAPVALAEEIRAVLREGKERTEVEGEYETPTGVQKSVALTISPLLTPNSASVGVACVVNERSGMQGACKTEGVATETSSEMALKLRASLRSISGIADQLAGATDPELRAQLAKNIAQEAAELDRKVGGYLSNEAPGVARAASAS